MSWLWSWAWQWKWLIVLSPMHTPQVRKVHIWFGKPHLALLEAGVGPFDSAKDAVEFLDNVQGE